MLHLSFRFLSLDVGNVCQVTSFMSELNPTSHMLRPCLHLNMLSSLLSLYQLCDAHQCVDIYWRLAYVTLCFWFCGLGFWFLAEQMGGNRLHQSVDSMTVFSWADGLKNTQKAEWWGRSSFGNNKIGTCKNHILRQFKPNKSTVNQFEKCLLLAPLTRCRKLKIGHSCQLAIMPFHHACLQAPNMSSQHGNFWMFFFALSGTNDPWTSWSFQFP